MTESVFEQMNAQARRLATEVPNVSGTGSDDAGLVTATCVAGGALSDVVFEPGVRRLSTDELRTAVLTASRLAADQARERLAALVAELTGVLGGSGTADIAGEITRQMDQTRNLLEEQQRKIAAMREQATSG